MAKKTDIRLGTLLAGIFTALVIVVSQLFYFENTTPLKKEVKTEQQQHASDATDDAGSASNEAYITLPSSTPPSSTHVEFQQQGFCLFEILFEENGAEEYDLQVALPASKFFLTLFQDIISPNAP